MVVPFEFRLQLRWADMDPLNHVNNARYLEYAQEARLAFLVERLGSVCPPVVVGRQEIDYLRPLVFRNQDVVVEVEVSTVRERSFTMTHTVRDPEAGGGVYACVLAVMVAVDRTSGGSRLLDDAERTALTALLPTG